jgi:hypothetical protein
MGDADGARAGDLEDLGGVRKAEVADGDDLEGALLDAAVATVTGPVGDGHALPRQALQAGQQGGLVGLDREQVVGLLAGDQELGSVSMVCSASAVTTPPARSRPASSDRTPGTSSGAPPTCCWASTARVAWSMQASRCTGRP